MFNELKGSEEEEEFPISTVDGYSCNTGLQLAIIISVSLTKDTDCVNTNRQMH